MSGTINLKRLHPHSIRYFFYLLAPYLLALILCAVCFLAGHIEMYITGYTFILSPFNQTTVLFLIGIIALIVARMVYCYFYLESYHYEVRAGNLVISKGILLRKQGSLPLRRITDVYIKNDWKSLFFGLYMVEVLTPSVHSQEFCCIEGLSRRTALALKERILNLIEGQIQSSFQKPKGKQAQKRVSVRTSARQLPQPHEAARGALPALESNLM